MNMPAGQKAGTAGNSKRRRAPTTTSCSVCTTRGRHDRGKRLAERAGGGGRAPREESDGRVGLLSAAWEKSLI
eukprot:6290881-Alexandrium_andersonii.AAC.1